MGIGTKVSPDGVIGAEVLKGGTEGEVAAASVKGTSAVGEVVGATGEEAPVASGDASVSVEAFSAKMGFMAAKMAALSLAAKCAAATSRCLRVGVLMSVVNHFGRQ